MEKSDFIIGIDMDDTIENLVEAWTKYLNDKHGYSLKPDDITHWELGKHYTTLTQEQIFEPLGIPEFWDTVTPKPDAVKYVKQLIDDGFTVYICTNSYYDIVPEKMSNVLFKYFPYLKWSDVIIMKYKSLCKFDVLVDDYWENLVYGEYQKILYKTAHAQEFLESGDKRAKQLHICTDWKQIYDTINQMWATKKFWVGRNLTDAE